MPDNIYYYLTGPESIPPKLNNTVVTLLNPHQLPEPENYCIIQGGLGVAYIKKGRVYVMYYDKKSIINPPLLCEFAGFDYDFPVEQTNSINRGGIYPPFLLSQPRNC